MPFVLEDVMVLYGVTTSVLLTNWLAVAFGSE